MIHLSSLEFDGNSLTRAIETVDLSQINDPQCEEFAVAFGRQIESSADMAIPLQFLAIICSWRLRADNDQMPFDCLWNPSRVSEVTKNQLAAIEVAVPRIKDPELRARLSDLIWIRQRKHQFAKIAAEDYIASAERLIGGKIILGEKERMSRAIQLANMVGRTGDLLPKIIDRLTTIAEKPNLEHCTLASCLTVLQRARGNDAARLFYYRSRVQNGFCAAKRFAFSSS